MSINALIGYVLVGVVTVVSSLLDLAPLSLRNIGILSAFVNGMTLAFIILLWRHRSISDRSIRIVFISELVTYLLIFGVVVFLLKEARFVTLFYALIAITIELPFTTVIENLMISLGTMVVQITVSYIAIFHLGQSGTFHREVFFALCIAPVYLTIAVVSRQINKQRTRIETGRLALSDANDQLLRANEYLEKEQTITNNEITLAAHVQRSFFSEPPTNLSDWDIALYFRPLYGVSGDFYDFYSKDGKLKGISLFDVSGHGLSSALYTMLLKPTIGRLFNRMGHFNLGKVLMQVNNSITREFSEFQNYITGIVLRIEDDTVEYVNAGHPDMYLRKSATRSTRKIDFPKVKVKGEPLGLSEDFPYRSYVFKVEHGDALLLFTDCLIEGCNAENKEYGLECIRSSFGNAIDGSAADILNQVMVSFFSHSGPVLQDDLTVIVAVRK
jgi:serine phosphatase RsbU (regulator of sigma subunit)